MKLTSEFMFNKHQMFNKLPNSLIVSPVLLLTLLFSGCDKFEGEQEIPAYIGVEQVNLATDYDTQGTSNNQIIDVWVYVDDNLVGAYEFPTKFPVLSEGVHKLELLPGIMMNGISATRVPYPYYNSYIDYDFDFLIDSIQTINFTTTYRSYTEFVWMEDFEDPSLAIVPHPQSDTGVYRTQPANDPDAFLDENSEHSGESFVDDENPYVLLLSDDGNNDGFALTRGDFIFMEINYKNDISIVTGMIIKDQSGDLIKRSLIGLNPSDTWKKVYINFTPIVNDNPGGVSFRVFIESYWQNGDPEVARIMIDNIKLVAGTGK